MTDPDSPQPPVNTNMLLVRSDNQVLQLSLMNGASVREALDATELRVRAACGGLGTCGACLIQIVNGNFNPPTLAERQKIRPEELADGMRLACQLRAVSDGELYLQYPAPHSQWKSLDASELYRAAGNAAIAEHVYGAAIDLGTTHIRLSFWNRQSGRRIGSRYSINPQVACGADVLTRLDADRLSNADSQVLTQLARKAIIEGIRDILSRDIGEVSPILAEIGKITIVGNTAMLTLICGSRDDSLYEPENWQLPITCQPADIESWRKAWRTPHAEIGIVQPLAGFIGSDLLADLLATAITEQPQPALLADFGTNTEIALWDGRTLWASSVPGGPAFEGVGMRNGLSAETGAVCKVSKHNGEWLLQTLDDAPARGYCGSGFIDAIALLLDEKLLKPSGRFAEPQPVGGYVLDQGNFRTGICPADIDMFQRAKASTAAAMLQLLVYAGLTANDLQTLWICGSFGRHLDLNNAMRVGLLPTVDQDRVKLLANAGLSGCEKLLLDPVAQAVLNTITGRARVVNLSGVTEYEERFVDNLRLKPV
ncbi:ASKHA domain-containing protein [Candidatus Methylobacter oryzae]|uniref:DUF4445 domain-containing protein n=1 Tax=Candidatus Methylobacter oryzae TaxID=2497749 RepID=A0ABY3C5C3_9GAMM|nr:ASKHA domain-containing protein [Candidatus Methylobacter oryzae]TRW89707.1 DUF4445 domain-containing protein [Candidatus Methylobacter oryzae]